MNTRAVFVLIGLGACAAGAAEFDRKVNWPSVPVKDITLFYPGQSSYEWMVSASHKAGAAGVRGGKKCQECHAGEEKDMGDAIASGKKLEPHVLPKTPGTLKVAIQAAHDGEHLYLRARWNDDGAAGIYYPAYMYQDGQWEKHGNHRGEDKVAKGEQPAVYEDRISFLIGDDAKTPDFRINGCWATCHNDLRYMPNHPEKEEIEAHPVLGKDGMKKSDIRKYLAESRTAMDATGGWKNIKSKEDVAALAGRGVFLDLLQWRGHRGNPVKMGDDGFVAEYRNFDAGKKSFTDNWDKDKNRPKWMIDPAKNNGRAALGKADLVKKVANRVLTDANAVPFDANRPWKDGDMLPQYLVTAKVEGSAGDVVAEGIHDGKGWTVVMRRRLNTGNVRDDIALVAGRTYTMGVAVHDDMTTARWHYVSFPLTFTIGRTDGDVNAVAVK